MIHPSSVSGTGRLWPSLPADERQTRHPLAESPTPKLVVNREVIDLMTRVGSLVTALGGGQAYQGPRHIIDILALFDRCRSMLGAIQHLLLHDFVHEAVMLGRPLFTDSVALAELASVNEKRRGDLVVGWEMASLHQLEGMFLRAAARGDDMTEALGHVAQRRTQLESYARQNGFSTRQWMADDHTKDLAEKHGRGDEYSALLVTHHFVHGTTMATSQRYSQVADDTIEVGGPAAELRAWANDAGLFAASSTLHAARAICQILGWDEPPELEALLTECESLGERLRAADSSS